jgi:hypothetical protein
MSGHTREIAVPIGELPFLRKPFTVDALAQAIQGALGPPA